MQCTLQLDTNGKLIPPVRIEESTGGNKSSKRLIVMDRKSGIRFLIDTGADVSVIPHHIAKPTKSSNITLYAANNSTIKTYGEIQLSIDIGLRRLFTWTLTVADVSQPILGNDFLHEFYLLQMTNHRRND